MKNQPPSLLLRDRWSSVVTAGSAPSHPADAISQVTVSFGQLARRKRELA